MNRNIEKIATLLSAVLLLTTKKGNYNLIRFKRCEHWKKTFYKVGTKQHYSIVPINTQNFLSNEFDEFDKYLENSNWSSDSINH